MYLPNASSTNHYYTSEQSKSLKVQIGAKMLKICLIPLVLSFQLLGALLMSALCAVILAFLTLIVGLYLIGRVIFGKKKSFGIKQKQSVPFCRQKSEGETSLLFIFLIFAVTHIFSLSWVLPKREVLSQSKEILMLREDGMDMEFTYE